MFIPDPNIFIPDPNIFYPGFRIRIKEFKYLNPKKMVPKLLEIWFGLFIPDPDFLHIPDPGSRGQKGTGSRIRNTGYHAYFIVKLKTSLNLEINNYVLCLNHRKKRWEAWGKWYSIFQTILCKLQALNDLVVVLNAGADADVDEILAGHADGSSRLDDACLHSHSHNNGVPATTNHWLITSE